MKRLLYGLVLAWATVTLAASDSGAAADPSPRTDPDTGLVTWTLRDGAISLELIQRLPDQTRAFFQGRGFPAASADEFARACVFQAIVGNAFGGDQVPVVAIDLRHWRVDAGQGPIPLPVEAGWQPRWAAAGVSQAAQIAFRWALFPTVQTFMTGDHGWGMIPFGLAPGTLFDLTVVWSEDGLERTAQLLAIQCTADRSIPPS